VLAAGDARESGVLSWLLREHGYDVSAVPANDSLLDAFRARRTDLVLLDASRDSIQEQLRRMRAEDQGRRTPVILLGVNRLEDATRALRMGADDWVSKPLSLPELLARIGARLRARTDASQARDTLIRREEELEQARADNRRLEELATTDSLTRLLNRRALLERLTGEVERAKRFKSQLSLLMVDLDHFKTVNDRYGHLAGDEVLRQIGELLARVVRTIDVVARYGGEEFVVALPETSSEGAVVFAERLRERVASQALDAGGAHNFHLTCSVGVATFPSPHVASTEALFARADEALYRAKSGGRNQVRV
jgi:two-component system cell cycle response regulator